MVIGQVIWLDQKQPFRGVLRKRCSENMQQIYRRTLMSKCDFTKRRSKAHKQRPEGIFKKRCTENMQQIYRRTPISKCDFSKLAKQLFIVII